jgi:hypothetical protein
VAQRPASGEFCRDPAECHLLGLRLGAEIVVDPCRKRPRKKQEIEVIASGRRAVGHQATNVARTDKPMNNSIFYIIGVIVVVVVVLKLIGLW